MTNRNRKRGSILLEFTLAGIPLIFVWISVVQMALTSWRYHTLQYAAKTAGSYIAVHGSDCTMPGNNCAIKVKDAAVVFRNAALGLPAASISLRFKAYKADHVTASSAVVCTLNNCLTNSTAWPPVGFNDPGCDIELIAKYTGLDPGGSLQAGGIFLNVMGNRLPGYTRQMILF